jgi:hypothetical protein
MKDQELRLISPNKKALKPENYRQDFGFQDLARASTLIANRGFSLEGAPVCDPALPHDYPVAANSSS